MNWVGHRNGGIVAAIATFCWSCSRGISAINSAILGLVTFLFSLYPDTDIHSTSGTTFYRVSIPFTIYLLFTHLFLGLLMLPILIVPKFSSHRGITHSLVWVAVVTVLMSYIGINLFHGVGIKHVGDSVVLGYITHLLLDRHVKII